jgi:hypothetical protein
MFLDLLDQLLTPCPRPVRALGYLREAMGIQRRYRRCREHWREHIERCKSIIRKGVDRCAQRRKAVILGAGLLHDVPLAELASSFHEVLLVDIVHPFRSRWRTRRLGDVRRVTADVTNTVHGLYWASDEPEMPLPRSRPDLLLDDPEIDFAVSLNLLSQLPCMPIEYLARYKAHSSQEIDDYAHDVIQAHLDYLVRIPGRVVLITDVERLKIDMMNRVVERKDLMFGLKLPKQDEEWEWRLAPCPEASPHYHFYRRVVGIADWK